MFKMNKAYQQFFTDNKIDPNNLSKKVIEMMFPIENAPFPNIKFSEIKTTGGFIRSLSTVKQGGGATVLPSEYFGKASNSYHSDVSTTNFTDATPQLTRLAIPATFKGGAPDEKSYKFVSVGGMKKFNPKANKEYTKQVNYVLKNVYTKAMKGGKITQRSLKEAFNTPL